MSRRKQQDPGVISFAEGLRKARITKLVLHAWERRYSLELSERTETGRRFFTVEQVERLRVLKLCTDAGYRIGQIIHLSEAALLDIAESHTLVLGVYDILAAIERLDAQRMSALLQARFDSLGAVEFAKRIVVPLMAEVGRRWAEGSVAIAAEHMASVEIRRLLTNGLERAPSPRPGAPRAIVTTVEGEMHEIGALLIALLGRHCGLDVLYLGPNLPVAEITAACRHYRGQIVCLSSLMARAKVMEARVVELRRNLPREILLWLGGPGFAEVPHVEATQYFQHVADFEQASSKLISLKLGEAGDCASS
ncbi:MerR family transcriptional regulator [Rhizobium oryzicola]|uniref:Cobalamin-dependent protein n=1 Tax=Rhizobium oryzicola TaxID=1232668 RepID=A0ABT8SX37_9HYPH|nr:cobalamin-dependent protein [Rhizobium oryzicola]MDO1582911.1 cobalamin-dependent protein [Rhizobium oryzicola]